MTDGFELLLFSIDTDYIAAAVQAGVDAIIVDWEQRGKHERQSRFDTQINQHTLDDLKRVRAATDALVICRINGVHDHTAEEIEQALDGGVDEIFLPMARTEAEVETVLRFIDGRCRLDILVETVDALALTDAFARLPLSRVYVGLNDLAIDRNLTNIFTSVADGTVERVRQPFRSGHFGFGGLTLPERGSPIPARLLMGELARLNSHFSFLRRSFIKDVPLAALDDGVARIRAALAAMAQRTPEQVAADQAALYRLIAERPQGPQFSL